MEHKPECALVKNKHTCSFLTCRTGCLNLTDACTCGGTDKPKEEVSKKCICEEELCVGGAEVEIGGVCHRPNNPCYHTSPVKEPSLEWDLKEIIKSWQFATCPTEEAEPFFWKWKEHGLEMLEVHIKSLLTHSRTEARREVIKEIRQGIMEIEERAKNIGMDYFTKSILDDFINLLTENRDGK